MLQSGGRTTDTQKLKVFERQHIVILTRLDKN